MDESPEVTVMPPREGGARLARSYLLAPGSHERILHGAFATDADAVVIDLEETVATEHKPRARALARDVLAGRARVSGPRAFVRINGVRSGLWRADLEAVVCGGLDGVRVAHVDSGEELALVHEALTELERARGLEAGAIDVIPTVESAAGVLRAHEIASGPRVRALAFGNVDFLRDVGATANGDLESLYARSHLVVASRAAGILPPIAPVHTRLADIGDLKRSSEAARRLGFFGRSCVHPSQLPVIHEVFTPSASEVADAESVLSAFEVEGSQPARALVLPDGQLADRTSLVRARAIVLLARSLSGSTPGRSA
jgi:citrate lyase subunit beta/citryl-CoA lyase